MPVRYIAPLLCFVNGVKSCNWMIVVIKTGYCVKYCVLAIVGFHDLLNNGLADAGIREAAIVEEI